jgi:hypothetical protein
MAFLPGGGAVVAFLLWLTGLAPGALLLAGVLWTLFGALSGLLDAVIKPLIDFANQALSNAGLMRRAELLAGPLRNPEAAVAELEALQREAASLIDRYPHTRQARELRGLLAALRAHHFAEIVP